MSSNSDKQMLLTSLHLGISSEVTREQNALRFTTDCNQSRKLITLFFFYKNIFYKNIEAEICEILRIL